MARRRNSGNALQAIQAAIDSIPGARDVLAHTAEQLIGGNARFRETHWGRGGVSPSMLSSVANHTAGIVELGALAEIGYLTQKGGRDRDLVLYQHKFSRPFPILGEAVDGSGLVIVRGHSTYGITARGIEG